MKARIEPFQDGLGEVRYRVIAETASWSAACRAKLEVEAVNERAFVSFDPPEEPKWPSDSSAPEYAPKPVSASYTTEAVSGGYPPNCDFVSHAHNGQEPTQAGQVLAQAQHEAAESGDQCTAGACLLTRGSD